MLNVTSSASVNVPPPNGLVTAMNKTNHAGKIDSKTRVGAHWVLCISNCGNVLASQHLKTTINI